MNAWILRRANTAVIPSCPRTVSRGHTGQGVDSALRLVGWRGCTASPAEDNPQHENRLSHASGRRLISVAPASAGRGQGHGRTQATDSCISAVRPRVGSKRTGCPTKSIMARFPMGFWSVTTATTHRASTQSISFLERRLTTMQIRLPKGGSPATSASTTPERS